MRRSALVAAVAVASAAFVAQDQRAVARDDGPRVGDEPAIGDFDGDGTPDLAVLVDWTQLQSTQDRSEIRLYSGKRGHFLRRIRGGKDDSSIGRLLTAIGDVDGDGATDLAVSALPIGGPERLDILSGKSGKVIRSCSCESRRSWGTSLTSLGDGSGKSPTLILVSDHSSRDLTGACRWTVIEPRTGKSLARSPESRPGSAEWMGDLDGDGCQDFALSTWTWGKDLSVHDLELRFLSGARVLAGDWSDGIVDLRKLGLSDALLERAGDCDRDGRDDFFALRADLSGLQKEWRIQIYAGPDGRALGGIRLGSAVRDTNIAGDVDGDGKPDFAVVQGESGDAPGEVTIRAGKDGGVLWRVMGRKKENFGAGLGTIPDADNDGVSDLWLNAPYASLDGFRGKGIFRFLSGKTGKVIACFNPLE